MKSVSSLLKERHVGRLRGKIFQIISFRSEIRVHEKLAKNFDQFRRTKEPKKYGRSLFFLMHNGDLDSRILDKMQVYLNEKNSFF